MFAHTKGMNHLKIIQRFHELQTQDFVHFTRPDIACRHGSRKLIIVFRRARFVWSWLNSPPLGQDLLIQEVSRSHTTTHHTTVLWTRDQLVTETSTLTLHNPHNRQTSMSPVGFEPTISAGERPQT
jgi:hypothetical protein